MSAKAKAARAAKKQAKSPKAKKQAKSLKPQTGKGQKHIDWPEKPKQGAGSFASPFGTSPFFKDILDLAPLGETPCEEETALNLSQLYFKEVARLGFKRSLELDSVINAYFYALARVKRQATESKEIIDSIRKEGFK